MATFVLNDETKVNCYGFRIPNKSIRLERFKANPVMLNDHQNSTAGVIGRWKNLRIEGSCLLADDDFDMDDPDAVKIKGKVDRGFIKGASMGIVILRNKMKMASDGVPEPEECEKHESSICAVPANSGSLVRLYDGATGELMTDDQVKLTLSALTKTTNFNHSTMKIVLATNVLAILALQAGDVENEVTLAAAITTLATKYESEKTAREKAQNDLKNLSATMATALVDEAQLAGKFLPVDRQEWLDMATSNLSLTTKMLAKMPGKQTLGGATNTNSNPSEVKTADDFQKLTHDAQLAFKRDHKDEYNKLFAIS